MDLIEAEITHHLLAVGKTMKFSYERKLLLPLI